jgi:hypothetical protein
MICIFCQTKFQPARGATTHRMSGDIVEVRTKCPKCRQGFYSLTATHWASLKHVDLFIKQNRKGQKR